MSIVGHAAPYGPPAFIGVNSILTGLGGAFQYSPSFTAAIRTSVIVMTGHRGQDYTAAEAGVPRAAGQTWHHVYNYSPANGTCTMQLVSTAFHQQTCPHAGACKQYSQAHGGQPYHLAKSGELTLGGPFLDVTPLEHTALMEFQYTTGLSLSSALTKLYTGKSRLRTGTLSIQGGRDLILDTVAPLDQGAGMSVLKQLEINRQYPISVPMDVFRYFGSDPYGNLFFCDRREAVWFYDHEEDALHPTELTLQEIME